MSRYPEQDGTVEGTEDFSYGGRTLTGRVLRSDASENPVRILTDDVDYFVVRDERVVRVSGRGDTVPREAHARYGGRIGDSLSPAVVVGDNGDMRVLYVDGLPGPIVDSEGYIGEKLEIEKRDGRF